MDLFADIQRALAGIAFGSLVAWLFRPTSASPGEPLQRTILRMSVGLVLGLGLLLIARTIVAVPNADALAIIAGYVLGSIIVDLIPFLRRRQLRAGSRTDQ